MYEDMEFYFLIARNADTVYRFLSAENLRGSWDEYHFPMDANMPEKVFTDVYDLIPLLLSASGKDYKKHEYIVYLENDASEMHIIAFLGDGNIVFGIPPRHNTPEDLGIYAEQYGGLYGYISPAHPEAGSSEKFKWDAPILYQGKEMKVVGCEEEFEDAP